MSNGDFYRSKPLKQNKEELFRVNGRVIFVSIDSRSRCKWWLASESRTGKLYRDAQIVTLEEIIPYIKDLEVERQKLIKVESVI